MAVSIPLSDASVRNTIRGAAIAAALVSVLFIKIAQGRNWARITNAVYTVSQLLAAVARSVVEDDPAWFTVAFGLAHGVGFVAVVMLFTTPANPWFRSGHESTAIETTSTSDTLTSASDPEPDSRSS
jgi:urea transporter